MEHMQSAIDDMLSQIPSAAVVILVDFIANNASWLRSPTTEHAGRAAFDHATANGPIERIAYSRLSDVDNHNARRHIGSSVDFSSGTVPGRRR